jgi:hypothetical protein
MEKSMGDEGVESLALRGVFHFDAKRSGGIGAGVPLRGIDLRKGLRNTDREG